MWASEEWFRKQVKNDHVEQLTDLWLSVNSSNLFARKNNQYFVTWPIWHWKLKTKLFEAISLWGCCEVAGYVM